MGIRNSFRTATECGVHFKTRSLLSWWGDRGRVRVRIQCIAAGERREYFYYRSERDRGRYKVAASWWNGTAETSPVSGTSRQVEFSEMVTRVTESLAAHKQAFTRIRPRKMHLLLWSNIDVTKKYWCHNNKWPFVNRFELHLVIISMSNILFAVVLFLSFSYIVCNLRKSSVTVFSLSW